MYKTYIFDFDYTLANSEKGIVMCFQLLFDAEGYEGIPEDAIRRTIGMTMYDAMKSLTGETDPDRIYELIKEYKVRFSDKYMTANTHLYPETLPVLKALKEKGSRCCIVSTKTRSRINETLRKYAMESLIDLVVGMEDVDNAKPAPDGINRVCDHFGLDKKDVLYIGDNTIDAKLRKMQASPLLP